MKRYSTGVMKFGDDWAGIFMRGDEALSLADDLERVLPPEYLTPSSRFGGVVALLRSCKEARS